MCENDLQMCATWDWRCDCSFAAIMALRGDLKWRSRFWCGREIHVGMVVGKASTLVTTVRSNSTIDFRVVRIMRMPTTLAPLGTSRQLCRRVTSAISNRMRCWTLERRVIDVIYSMRRRQMRGQFTLTRSIASRLFPLTSAKRGSISKKFDSNCCDAYTNFPSSSLRWKYSDFGFGCWCEWDAEKRREFGWSLCLLTRRNRAQTARHGTNESEWKMVARCDWRPSDVNRKQIL